MTSISTVLSNALALRRCGFRCHLTVGALAAPLLGILVESNAHAQGAEAARFIEVFRPQGIISAVLYIGLAILLIRGISAITERLGERFTERRLLAHQVNTLMRFSVYIVTFSLALGAVFRLDRQTMLAIGGTIAVSVGFALKDLAASVIAGITILFDRPFRVGDRVTFGNHYGEICSIGLRSVRLRTLDDSIVTIPNNRFLTEVVVSANAGELDMQVVIDFYVAPDTDISEAKRIVYEGVRTSSYVFLEKPVVVLVSDMILQGYVTTRLRAKAYVLDVRYEKHFETDVTERVKLGFASAGIAAPRRRNEHRGVASGDGNASAAKRRATSSMGGLNS